MELNVVKEAEVLVIGAGPTGLVLACDLRRRGVAVRVVERAATLFPGSRGKGIQPRTLEVLDDLGVVAQMLEKGAPVPVSVMWRDGERRGEHRMVEESERTESEPYPNPWQVPQWRTQEILYARLVELGGSVEFGTALTALTQDAQGVTARLATGERVRARYVVGADGGRSSVRRLLGVGMKGEDVDPAPMLVADVVMPALDRLNWHTFIDDDGRFLALCPLPHTDTFQLVAQVAGGAAPDLTAAGVRSLVASRTHLAAEDVTEVTWASDFRPRAALADRFQVGRVFLAGDAAHVHSPAGGQGLNTSIQDAYNLGWKLGQVLTTAAPGTLLDTYELERRPLAAEMLGLSTRIHRGEEQRGSKTGQLCLNYRGSPLATGAAGALAAGDRAPDGPLPDGTRIFDTLRGPHITLLAVGADTPPRAELPAAVVLCHIPAPYAPYGRGLFLIRPDGYVGWAGEDTKGMDTWLAGVGVS